MADMSCTYLVMAHFLIQGGEKVTQQINSTLSLDSLPATLCVEDLMPLLGIGRNTAYRLVRSGEIRSIKIGRQIRIPRQVLLDYLEQK